jgi:hypothetical protein
MNRFKFTSRQGLWVWHWFSHPWGAYTLHRDLDFPAGLEHARAVRFALSIGVLFAAIWFGVQALDIIRSSGFTDFDILFHSAQRLAQGHSPYLRGLFDAPFGGYYKFPPLVDQLLAPLTGLEWVTLARIYAVIGLGLYLAAFLLLARLERFPFLSVPYLLLALVFLAFQPSLDTLNGPQHEFLILVLFILAYMGMTRAGRGQWLAGVSIGVTVMLKIYPILILPYFILRGAWRAVIALIATLVGLTLFSVWLGGWDLQRQFWLEIFPHLSGSTAWLENQSFFAFFARWFVNGATADPVRVTVVPIATWLSYTAIAVSLGITLWVLLRDSRPRYAFAIGVPLALLIGPDSWMHYETLLLFPFALWVGEFRRTNASAWWWLALCVAVIPVAWGNEDNLRATSWGLIQSYKFYGVFLFWLIAVAWTWTHAQASEAVLPKLARLYQTKLQTRVNANA